MKCLAFVVSALLWIGIISGVMTACTHYQPPGVGIYKAIGTNG